MNIFKSDSIDKIKEKVLAGGTVKFEKGIYNITKQLVIPSDTTIDLNGATLRRSANIQSIFISKASKNTTKYTGAKNIIIKNGTLEGMGKYVNPRDNLLTLFHAKNVQIENVTFKDILSHGAECNSSSDVVITNCKFIGYNPEEDNFRESVQLDQATFSAMVLAGTKSKDKCYDGTGCKNITISNCTFDKSSSRKASAYCIGNHSQGKNIFHENIAITNNKFIGDSVNKNGCAIRLVSMRHVKIEDNYSENYARFVFITNYITSYTKSGTNVSAINTSDGLCDDVVIKDNRIKPLNTYKVVDVYTSSKTEKEHTRITKENNKIVK